MPKMTILAASSSSVTLTLGKQSHPCCLKAKQEPSKYMQARSTWEPVGVKWSAWCRVAAQVRRWQYIKPSYKWSPRSRSVKSRISVIAFNEEAKRAINCRLGSKLLSLDGRNQVHIRRISVSLTTACSRHHQILPSVGSGIDLDSVRSMVEGSQLSSGAQQLMSMVQFQQRNTFPFGDQLQRFLGKPNFPLYSGQDQADGLQTLSTSGSATIPLSCKSNLTGSQLAKDLGTGDGSREFSARMTQDTRGDFKAMVTSFLQTSKTKDKSSPNPDFLPFLHSLCGEVKHLRIGEQDQQSQRIESDESTVNTEQDELKPYCFLEEIISKQMSAMEKRLLDHIDNRMNRLQEIMDTRMMLLAELVQRSHLSTGDRLTNGEVHLYSDLRSTY